MQLTPRTESDIIRSEEEYVERPEPPSIARMVEAVTSSRNYRDLVDDRRNYMQSKSRDLTPLSRRPITSVVAGKYHVVRPARSGMKPPKGYVPVHTNQGRVFWRRVPNLNRRTPPSNLVLRVPLDMWRNARAMNLAFPAGAVQLFIVPTHNAHIRISTESLDVNIDQNEERDLIDGE